MSLENTIETEFAPFFQTFKERAKQGDIAYLKSVISKDLAARENRHGSIIDYGYEESIEGWGQAFDFFADQDMQWVYTDHSTIQLKVGEVMATFWISLVLDGKKSETANLFVNTYQKDPMSGEWKLVRTYIEAGVENPTSINA
ncbi:flavoprotein [Thalassobacillus sp. CUG 92003]|uniref:flavoprotein n=1 Tax=Thalassobacillus sp. CUG 92003 TaxID=2736641 RepID=UPI0015E68257|nr:flavoprotein [Thalassobacillus sp. CUG 92003]